MFSKWLPMEAAILKETFEPKIIKLTHLTKVMFVSYVNTQFMGLFYEYCTFRRHYWKKINIQCELMMSQPH